MNLYNQILPFNSPNEAIQSLDIKINFCLFESTEITEEKGKLSLLGFDPCLELKGKKNYCQILIYHKKRAEKYLLAIENKFSQFIIEKKENSWILNIPKLKFYNSEDQRIDRQNSAQIIRFLLKKFKTDKKTFLGLYGAFSYYFIYQFEDIKSKKVSNTQDFHLFLFDSLIIFDHIYNKCELYLYRQKKKQLNEDIQNINLKIKKNKLVEKKNTPTILSNIVYSPSDKEFKKQIKKAIEYCYLGEFMEVVLSRKITAHIKGNPYLIYENYKTINPSPYLFYFNLNREILLGASPEIMIKCHNRKITLKPISGTVKRGSSILEDHISIMNLLNSKKEKAELDMLIDLGRNDLSRICKSGIIIEKYRSIEKYSHVYHTVAKISGILEEKYSGFDALIHCLNAGTLTGTPKIAAMNFIEEIESHERGYYGGSIGYMTFDGEVNTAITIRTMYIKNEIMQYLSGATILYESTPEGELDETQNKAAAFIKAIEPFIKKK